MTRSHRSKPHLPLSFVRVVFMLGGTVATLMLAACRTSAGDAPTQVIARVNGDEISVHQLNQAMQALPPPPSASAAERTARALLERLIEQQVAVQQALAADLDRDPTVMQALTAARRDVLARAWLDRVAQDASAPEESDLRAAYDAAPLRTSQRRLYDVQELVVAVDAAGFADLRQRLLQAGRFEQVINHLRARGTPVQATRRTLPAEAMAPAMLQQLSRMRDGQAVLLGAPGAARIVVLLGSQPAPLSFEAARPALTAALAAERRREAARKSLSTLTLSAQVERLGRFAASDAASADPAAPAALTETTTGPETVSARPPAATDPLAPAAADGQTPAGAPLPSAAPAPAPEAADRDAVRKGLAGLR